MHSATLVKWFGLLSHNVTEKRGLFCIVYCALIVIVKLRLIYDHNGVLNVRSGVNVRRFNAKNVWSCIIALAAKTKYRAVAEISTVVVAVLAAA